MSEILYNGFCPHGIPFGQCKESHEGASQTSPIERAKLVYEEHGRKGSWNYFDKRMIDAIADQIRQAVEEAYRKGFSDCNMTNTSQWNEAIERAAKVAEELCWKDHGDDNCLKISGDIKSLKVGEGK